jgi:hypothetical protein
MIPAAAPFLILSSRIMQKKEVLIAQLLQKIPSQWKPMCILKQNFIDGISQNNE